MKINKLKYISIILLIIWLIVIFLFSNQKATESNNVSNGISNLVSNVFGKTKNKEEFKDNVNYIVRKTAHFTEYLILGILVINVLRFYNIDSKKLIMYSIIFCILYAASDEYHQMFISDRSPQVRDVLIDSLGSISGIMLFNIKYKSKPKSLN